MARILIVDDSPSQLIGMRRTVEKLGHQVVTAEDGAAGVETAKRVWRERRCASFSTWRGPIPTS